MVQTFFFDRNGLFSRVEIAAGWILPIVELGGSAEADELELGGSAEADELEDDEAIKWLTGS